MSSPERTQALNGGPRRQTPGSPPAPALSVSSSTRWRRLVAGHVYDTLTPSILTSAISRVFALIGSELGLGLGGYGLFVSCWCRCFRLRSLSGLRCYSPGGCDRRIAPSRSAPEDGQGGVSRLTRVLGGLK